MWRPIFKKYKEWLFMLLVYWLACAALLALTGKLLNVGLAWNLFLAFLPLLFMEKARSIADLRWSRFWLFLWLIFFPNSLYPITSFIHLSTDTFYWVEGDYPMEVVVYEDDIYIWWKVFLIGIGFLFSVLAGWHSLYFFEKEVQEKYSRKIGYAAVSFVCFLTGLAVFWGRFLRLNSWDILVNPFQLLQEVVQAFNKFTWEFTFAFTVFSLAGYILYRMFRKLIIPDTEEFS